jgi:hypothetical protein
MTSVIHHHVTSHVRVDGCSLILGTTEGEVRIHCSPQGLNALWNRVGTALTSMSHFAWTYKETSNDTDER